ncbi:MAG: LD-carboxypeptidase [Lachnospiraceae bacterium]|nr:LD-carboxypeptidase [Lachnospiraceae bacterium]MDO4318772.1 LD-carboxypeptidase [Lachnospiraceae bacterium]
MRYPEFLTENGTIGFVAPSFGCNIEPYRTAFLAAQEKFVRLGHRLTIGPNCYEGRGIGISNTPELCARELTESYCSEESDVLISCGGGELMCEILDDIDWEWLRQAKPKWFLGYSDNTNVTLLLTTLCDVASVYGPCAAVFGMEPWHPAITDAYELLRGRKLTMEGYDRWEKESLKSEENPCAPYHATEPRVLRFFTETEEAGEIRMEGRLLGGCMDCLVNLLGTQYDRVGEFAERYREDGVIWFLEACDLNVMAIRRAVWQMQHAGWFRHVKGFLIGRPLQYGQTLMGLDQYHAVYDLLREYRVPVVMDVDLGHLPPMMPLICGAKAVVTGSGQQLTVAMKCE